MKNKEKGKKSNILGIHKPMRLLFNYLSVNPSVEAECFHSLDEPHLLKPDITLTYFNTFKHIPVSRKKFMKIIIKISSFKF